MSNTPWFVEAWEKAHVAAEAELHEEPKNTSLVSQEEEEATLETTGKAINTSTLPYSRIHIKWPGDNHEFLDQAPKDILKTRNSAGANRKQAHNGLILEHRSN